MTLDEITKAGIDPALQLLPSRMDGPQARVMLLAIGLQESRFSYRFQIVKGRPGIKGPAKSFWQFEEPTVGLVLRNPVTARHANMLCSHFGLASRQRDVHWAMEENDVLAAAMARLLLWADAKPLPDLGDVEGAWTMYADRAWRPGKPHRHTWDAFYMQALEYVLAAEQGTRA